MWYLLFFLVTKQDHTPANGQQRQPPKTTSKAGLTVINLIDDSKSNGLASLDLYLL
jgi:hypothetical protein